MMWTELKEKATRYDGRQWNRGRQTWQRLTMQPAVLHIMQKAGDTRAGRRSAMVDVCTEKITKYTRRMEKAERRKARTDDLEKEMAEALQQSTMGGVVNSIFKVLARAKGGGTGAGGGKLIEMNGIDGEWKGRVVRGAGPVRQQAHAFGVKQHAEGWAYTNVAREWMVKLWPGEHTRGRTGEGLDSALKWETYVNAVEKAEKEKGVGTDGFNGYLLRHAPHDVRKEYWELLVDMVGPHSDVPT
eukprot:675971-Prymnesium_polylepis.1